MDELKKRQLIVELRRNGYINACYDAERDAVMPMDKDFPGIQIRSGEIWMPNIDDSELRQRQRDLVYSIFKPISDKVSDMVYAWRNAFPMVIKDVSNFRLFSEHGKTVLAARDDGERGLHFVTWEYTYNRTGVNHGHYTVDFDAAKKDFAIRSGLIPEKSIFDNGQLAQIHSALVFQGKTDDEITFTTEKALYRVIEKIESMLPGLQAKQESTELENRLEPEQ